jgi:uncharacterized protein YggE
LKDISLIEALLDAALNNGANRMYGLEFKHSEMRKHRDEARKMAARAAKEKAELLAGELDAQVGKPIEIYENPQSYYAAKSFQNSVQYDHSFEGAGDRTLVGQIEVSASVYVKFCLV